MLCSPVPLHGRVGTPTVCATIVDAILSPRAHIAEAGGPVHKTNLLIIPDFDQKMSTAFEVCITPKDVNRF